MLPSKMGIILKVLYFLYCVALFILCLKVEQKMWVIESVRPELRGCTYRETTYRSDVHLIANLYLIASAHHY